MSLVSVRNFIAPFTNTTHLATILLFALIFGVYRLSGGGIRAIGSKGSDRFIESESPSRNRAQPANQGNVFNQDRGDSVSDELFNPRREVEKLVPPSAPKLPNAGRVAIPDNSRASEDLLNEMMGGSDPQPIAPARVDPPKAEPARPADNSGSLEDIERSLGLR